MYEAMFGLRERPFAAAPSAERYFPGTSIENARKALTRCIERAEGTGIVIGPSGTGKTLLCQLLAQQLKNEFTTVMLASGRMCTRRALLQAILFELGLPYRGLEEGELRLTLLDHLAPRRDQTAALVLFVDEAHTLPWRLLEELRLLSNLIREGQPRVRLVLAGGPQLEERFASPKLDSFNQRLAARCYLESLEREECYAYARFQITAAGGNPDLVFAADALQSVYRASDGIPRLINQVCDHAMILAAAGGHRQITAVAIDEAWADLQQLPAPWSSSTEVQSAKGSIEFGKLEDADDAPDAIPFRSPSDLSDYEATPAEKIERIQAQLASIDDEFLPAGSIGPEVELVFHHTIDPFGERFEEEEVVLDRYASLDQVFTGRPTVSSREGRDLSELLGSCTAKAGPQPPYPPEVSREPGSGSSHPMPASLTASCEPDDDDLIIVEDDPHPAADTLSSGAPLARRQDYRQLFAKLRRG